LIGFKYLAAMHLNDAKGAIASHLDRHAPLGDGVLGWEFFGRIMSSERFDNIPLILETPEPDRWKNEISTLKSLAVSAESGR
jgi:deoxyribonuclease-4